jgi:hypothetical protein
LGSLGSSSSAGGVEESEAAVSSDLREDRIEGDLRVLSSSMAFASSEVREGRFEGDFFRCGFGFSLGVRTDRSAVSDSSSSSSAGRADETGAVFSGDLFRCLWCCCFEVGFLG